MQILIYIGAFFLIAAIGFIPLIIVYFVNKLLYNAVPKMVYYIIVAFLFIGAFILNNQLYFPDNISFFRINRETFWGDFFTTFFLFTMIPSLMVYIPYSWLGYKYVIGKTKPEQFKLRKRAAILLIILLCLWKGGHLFQDQMVKYSTGKGDTLIEHVESYKSKHGVYPDSLITKNIVTPGLNITDTFIYAKQDQSYYLYFVIYQPMFLFQHYIYDPDSVFIREKEHGLKFGRIYFHKRINKDWVQYDTDG